MLNIPISGKRGWHSNDQCISGLIPYLTGFTSTSNGTPDIFDIFDFNFDLHRTLVNMCKASDTTIVNKGSGPTDNEIVNDQSTNLINFHEKYPVATMMLFGVMALIVYFIHRKYCSQKAVTKPVDQPSSPTPAAMVPTAPMAPPPSILFPLQQHLNLQQPFNLQQPINFPWGYHQQPPSSMSGVLPLPAFLPRQTPQIAPVARSKIRSVNPTSADAPIERKNEDESIVEVADGTAGEFSPELPYGQRYIWDNCSFMWQFCLFPFIFRNMQSYSILIFPPVCVLLA